jgi:outer membrane protein, heavy metal efflux system
MRWTGCWIIAAVLLSSAACAGRSRTPLQLSQTATVTTAPTNSDTRPVVPVAFQDQSESSADDAHSDDNSDDDDDDKKPWDENARPSDFPSLTLADAIATAMANNPTLAQTDAAIQRVRSQGAQVGFYPNPTVGYTASNIGDDQTAGEHGIYMSQTWVTAGKLQWNRTVAAGDIAAAQAIHEAQYLRVTAGVTALFYAALAAQRQVEAARRLEEIAEEGLAITERRYEAGLTTRGDLLQAEVVLDRAAIGAGRAGIAANAAWRRLAAAIGCPQWQPMRLVGELGPPQDLENLDEIDVEPLWLHVRANSPELQAAAALVARTQARIGRERAEAIPNLDFQGQVQHDFANDQVLGGIQVGVPLPLRHRNQGAISAAHAEHHRAIANYRRVELNLRDRLVVAIGDAESAGRRIESYRDDIVPKAEESLELIKQQYDEGETDLLRLLTAQESYAAALVDLITFQADWQQAWATLDGILLGDPLDAPPEPTGPGYGAGFTGVSRAQ